MSDRSQGLDIRRTALQHQPGSVLLLVLVVVAILALGTNTYLQLMQSEHRAVRRHGRAAQTMRLAESGIEYLKAIISQTPAKIQLLGGLANNAAIMEAQLANDQPDEFARGRFTILCPTQLMGLYSGVRFGLEDESAKLNLHTLLVEGLESEARLRLLALPAMTPDVADAMLDWLDPDSRPREYGAEQDYYGVLDPPYAPRNGPIANLDELLQVRGVTPELLYGLDRNRNMLVEGNELPRGAMLEVDNSEGAMNRGWSAYLTITSVELLGGSAAAPMINLNGDLTTLYNALKTSLTDEQAKFIVLYRQYGAPAAGASDPSGRGQPGAGGGDVRSPAQRPPTQPGQPSQPGDTAQPVSASTIELNLQQPGGTQLTSMLDLVGAVVQVPATPPGGPNSGASGGQNGGGPNGGNQGNGNQPSGAPGGNGGPSAGPGGGGPNGGPPTPPPKAVMSPWQDNANSYRDLLKLCDIATAANPGRVAGRININAASRPVLMSIPYLSPVAIEQIIARRELEPDLALSEQRHALWLLIEGAIPLAGMRQVERFITTRGDAFSGQSIGFFDADAMPTRVEFVLDRSVTPPRLRRLSDLSSWGPGFSPDFLGVVPDDER